MATFMRCDVCGNEAGTMTVRFSNEPPGLGQHGCELDICKPCRKALYAALGKAGKSVANGLCDMRTLTE